MDSKEFCKWLLQKLETGKLTDLEQDHLKEVLQLVVDGTKNESSKDFIESLKKWKEYLGYHPAPYQVPSTIIYPTVPNIDQYPVYPITHNDYDWDDSWWTSGYPDVFY